MDVVLDNIIFELQSNGGITTYWKELINRAANTDRFNLYLLESNASVLQILLDYRLDYSLKFK